MEKGFRDIEEFFLQAEKEMRKDLQQGQRRRRVQRGESREELLLKLKNLSEKLKGKDRKIRELIKEVVELKEELDGYRKREEELKKREEELKEIERFKSKVEALMDEIAKLKGELKEKETQIENLKAKEVPKPKVELFIEVALNSLSEFTAGKKRLKVLFSKRFRKDMVKEVSVRPFLFNGFISALERIETTSRLLKRDSKHDIYRLRVTSPYGEYRAVYLKLEDDVIKFVRFGQRDSIYQELDACNWSFS
ncbi:type II toxin-antitoxin system RelE family toxin [Thermovibrio sp.]